MTKKKYSTFVTDGADKAPNRAMLRAVGFTNSDFKKPVIGVASTWAMVTPCNMHIDILANEATKCEFERGKISYFLIQSLSPMVFQWELPE